MPYHQLTSERREVISQLHYSGTGPTKIARQLKRSPSTVSRELARNNDSEGYRAVAAQERTSRRRREHPIMRKMDDSFINESVRTGLSQEWSPEEIAGRMRRNHRRTRCRRVSYQTIYRWLKTCEYRSHFRSFMRHGRYRNVGAWMDEATSETASASNSVLRESIHAAASVTGRATRFTVQITPA